MNPDEPTWLGPSPNGTGWRYMHPDGRVEDMDPAVHGLPPGWAPPGFEGSVPQAAPPPVPPMGAEPPLQQPAPAPVGPPTPVQNAPTAAPTKSSSSTAVSTSFRGPTLGIEGSPGTSDRLSQRAASQATGMMAPQVEAAKAERAAVNESTQAQIAGSRAQAQGEFDMGRLERSQAEERLKDVADIHERSARWTSDIQAAMEAIPPLDPKKMFVDASDGETVGMAAAAFMGGFLQPVLGTNAPMDIINKAIDRNIDAQKNAQEMGQRKVWNLKDLAARDESAALFDLNQRDTDRAMHLTALKHDITAKVMGYQSDVFKAQGSKLLADIDKELTTSWQNVFVNTRNFLETQRHSMRMESIQSQELAVKRAQAESEAAARKAAAQKDMRANFLHHDTGVRAQGPNAMAGGWVAPNEKIRQEAAEKFEGFTNGYSDAESIKRLLHGNWGPPGSEERKRAGAAVQRAAFELMSKVPGLGQKEDMAQMKSVFGGDRDGVFNFASKDTALKVLQDLQDNIYRNANSYAHGLQYDPNDKVSWEPPTMPAEADHPEGPSIGTGALRAKAGLEAGREDELVGGLTDIAAEIKTYPGLAKTPDGRKHLEQTLATLDAVPEDKRMVLVDGANVDIKDVVTHALIAADEEDRTRAAATAATRQIPDTSDVRMGFGK